jgi:hypothetical protein
MGMLKAFQSLLQTRKAKHEKLLTKFFLVEIVWRFAFEKLEMC